MTLQPVEQRRLTTPYQRAIEFRRAMGQSVGLDDPRTNELQLRLIREEYREFTQAASDCPPEAQAAKAEALKELADLVFVCYQYAAARGWDLDEAYKRVWASNMSKLDDEGNPIRREDGKILKGPNYRPPQLLDLV